jgi:hypothetical protein
MKRPQRPILLLVWGALVCAPALGASPPPSGQEAAAAKGWTFTLFPEENFYSSYIGDPFSSDFGLLPFYVADDDIEDAGTKRLALKLGGTFPMISIHKAGRPERGWVLNVEAGFYGQFDFDTSLDNIGWDGTYGLLVSHAFGERWSVKGGIHHRSSHLGDEYIESTGRERIDYTRDEFQGAVSRRFGHHWRAYAEAGYAFSREEDIGMEQWRLQSGLEYEVPRTLWRGRAGWYVAGNVTSFEEQDWDPDISVEGGLVFPSGKHRYRLGLSYYQGQVPIGEFFREEEKYVSLGLTLDL